MFQVLGRLLLECQPYRTPENPIVRPKALGYQALLVLLRSYSLLVVSLRSPADLLLAGMPLRWGLYIE